MSIELKVPDAGESIEEVRIVEWLKEEGGEVEEDEDLVELETDKASMALPAPVSGVLSKVMKGNGDTASVGETIAHLEESDESGTSDRDDSTAKRRKKSRDKDDSSSSKGESSRRESRAKQKPDNSAAMAKAAVTPSARRALRKHGLAPDEIDVKGSRTRREDVERYARKSNDSHEETASEEDAVEANAAPGGEHELTEVVPMSRLRLRIATRLVKAQQQAALLTTFNEVDMSAVIKLRRKHGEQFASEYEVRLGYMSFFVKAVVDALRQFPAINAEVRDDDILYHNYYHIGIAVGSKRGLVVPVLRHAERMSFAEIEAAIDDFATRADDNRLEPQELQGGTFTVSNGGVYGSLLSTPIVNPPQSGVLGMHAIEQRPVARDGEVVIRPMMYVAMTYDHRLVDGREAVLFLRRIKEAIEEPARMLIEV